MKYKQAAPKILHGLLDFIYLRMEDKRKWANKSGIPKTKDEICSESFVITIPKRKPYPSIRIEISEHNPPEYDSSK